MFSHHHFDMICSDVYSYCCFSGHYKFTSLSGRVLNLLDSPHYILYEIFNKQKKPWIRRSLSLHNTMAFLKREYPTPLTSGVGFLCSPAVCAMFQKCHCVFGRHTTVLALFVFFWFSKKLTFYLF